jgi:hypothetical protein
MATETTEATETYTDSVPRIHVTLVTKSQCGFCEDAKELLARLAQAYPLAIETVKLDSPQGARLALEGGILFPPGIFLDGEPFAYGRPSERLLRREFARRSAALSARRNEPSGPRFQRHTHCTHWCVDGTWHEGQRR